MRFFQALLLAAVLANLGGCVKLTLAWADLKGDGDAASPPVLGAFGDGAPVESEEEWRAARAPALKDAFQRHIYGRMPETSALTLSERRLLDDTAFGGAGRLIEYKLNARVGFGSEVRETGVFYMDVVTPKGAENPPIILMQTFCPRWNTIPHPAIHRPEGADGCEGGGILRGVMTYVFGRYIATPPIEMILDRGYAVATIYPSEFAPDNRARGLAALTALAPGMAGDARWGAIAAWAWGYSLMIDALAADEAFAASPFITWGHSRYGKSALVAAAFDERIDAVVSHQSGTGGASLNRRKKGESVKAITDNYPHWFASAYGAFAGREEEMPVDQHQLLALIAPRPVLLGNARRDVWSDPNGAFRAAMGADPVYELMGAEGLDQTRLDQWKPDADIAFWLRAGTHGVVKEDWPAFLEFLDAHFGEDKAFTR
ncbi:MAG: alpha/beta hydrolase [Pseudomonadota bacterium]